MQLLAAQFKCDSKFLNQVQSSQTVEAFNCGSTLEAKRVTSRCDIMDVTRSRHALQGMADAVPGPKTG